jgi:hypothetical protein
MLLCGIDTDCDIPPIVNDFDIAPPGVVPIPIESFALK